MGDLPQSNQETSSTPGKSVRMLRLQRKLQMLTWFLREQLPVDHSQHFSWENISVTPFDEQGVSNHAFTVQSLSGQELIIRMKQKPVDDFRTEKQWSNFHKELWITQHYSAVLPIPRALSKDVAYIPGKGRQNQYAYIIQERLPYPSAAALFDSIHRFDFFASLASACKRLNSLATVGFGSNFLAETRTFEHLTWQAHIKAELEALELSELVLRGKLTEQQASRFENIFLSLRELDPQPRLYHRDVLANWSNVLIDNERKVQALIDWELAGSGIGVPEELTSLLYVLYRNGADDPFTTPSFRAVLNAYGMTNVQFDKQCRELVDIFLLRFATEKVLRYVRMEERGELGGEWQWNFYRRAEALLQGLLSKQPEQQIAAIS